MNKLIIEMDQYVRDIKNSKYPHIKGLDINFTSLFFFELF